MTNLEILKKAFENCGFNCEFEEKDDNLEVRVSLFGINKEFTFCATYDKDVELDYVIPNLKLDFDYDGTVSNEEGWFTTNMMKKYCNSPEENGIYACENIINTWESEESALNIEWDSFSLALEKRLNILQE